MSEPSEPTAKTTTAQSNATSTPLPTSTNTATKKIPPARLPTLNQLAARITSNASAKGDTLTQPNTQTSVPRPRLAAFGALRTGSQTSLSTAISTADSMAVNPPSTRSVSPAMSSTSQQSSSVVSGTPIPEGGQPLSEERVERLNQETASTEGAPMISLLPASMEPPKKRSTYKTMPTLDVITARMAKQRAMTLSVDGSANPPEPEMIDDPKSPGVPIKAPEHPLQFSWCGPYCIFCFH